MTATAIGELEHLVLLALMRLGGEAYTVPIIDEIEERTDRPVGHASAYVALRRLEKRGLVASWMGDPDARRGGRAKRHFKLEPGAVAVVTEARERMSRMWEGLVPERGA